MKKKVLSAFIVIMLVLQSFSFNTMTVFSKAGEFEAAPISGLTGFNGLKTVVNSKGVAAAINNSGAIAVCDNLSAASWRFITNEKDIVLRDIIVSNDEFIAVGELDDKRAALVMQSKDGIHWSEKTIDYFRFFTICETNGEFFLTGRNNISEYCMFKTKDFKTYTKLIFPDKALVKKYAPETLDSNHLMNDEAFFWPINMTYFNGSYVVSGYVPHTPYELEGIILTSSDLKTWKVGATSDLCMSNIVQGKDRLIVYGSNAESAYLSDSGALGGGSGAKYPTSMYITTDGKKFTKCNIEFNTGAGGFSKITYCNGIFFGIGYKTLGTSPDGINWSKEDSEVNWQFAGYGNGQYCAIGTKTNGQGEIAIAQSSDGKRWESLGYNGDITQLNVAGEAIYSSGYFLSSGGTSVSKDLINWKSNIGAQNESYVFSLFDGSRYIAVSRQRVLSSGDGEKWEVKADFGSRKDPFSQEVELQSIEFSAGTYILYGLKWGNGWELYAWISNDLMNWDARKINVSGIENTNSSLNGAVITVSGNKALLVYADQSADTAIVASAEDFINFNTVLNVREKGIWFNKPVCINGKWLFSSRSMYAEKVNDMLYISGDLVNFKKVALPVKSVSNIVEYKEYYAIVSNNTGDNKITLTKDFKKFESFKFPLSEPDPNLFKSGLNAFDARDNNRAFVIGDIFFVLGEKVFYTNNFKDWKTLQGLPPNNYLTASSGGKTAVVGGVGIMAIVK